MTEVGCLLCLLKRQERRGTVQHVTEGGRRLGHDYTYSSCPWHHQGVKEHGWSMQEMMGALGPSFAHGRKNFEEVYGDERNVLVRLQDWVLARSYFTDGELQEKWIELKRAH
jgi:hypothetical protein